ncbi:helix-turn-helix domain-containing protein [Paenibacillus eucommiae]|uniref:Transcriptional regulator with XRE-family HTH domain n=1 Tax=Paenibacillus eucommiae TaxID=1355755 RepID=A0ABS4J3E5_9BACL|nr:helix-turn-helix transcriptional regulator [Paenibacillus eucommiae]MBP1994369.1 transcriptional regulator with XRE-family HTH domain [Paenibacillus eucommiae]
MDIGARIKQLRFRSRINQEQLAENIMVSRGNVGDWERGRAKPGADALLSLAKFFNVSVDWILSGESLQRYNDIHTFEHTDTERASSKDIEIMAKLSQMSEKDLCKVVGYIDAVMEGYQNYQKQAEKREILVSTNGEAVTGSDES